jgi:hypothetical protein
MKVARDIAAPRGVPSLKQPCQAQGHISGIGRMYFLAPRDELHCFQSYNVQLVRLYSLHCYLLPGSSWFALFVIWGRCVCRVYIACARDARCLARLNPYCLVWPTAAFCISQEARLRPCGSIHEVELLVVVTKAGSLSSGRDSIAVCFDFSDESNHSPVAARSASVNFLIVSLELWSFTNTKRAREANLIDRETGSSLTTLRWLRTLRYGCLQH